VRCCGHGDLRSPPAKAIRLIHIGRENSLAAATNPEIPETRSVLRTHRGACFSAYDVRLGVRTRSYLFGRTRRAALIRGLATARNRVYCPKNKTTLLPIASGTIISAVARGSAVNANMRFTAPVHNISPAQARSKKQPCVLECVRARYSVCIVSSNPV